MTYPAMLGALADPTRRQALEGIVNAPRSVGELAQGLPVCRPAVSQHIRILKAAGLVLEQRAGTRHIFSIDTAGLADLRSYVDGLLREALSYDDATKL